MHKLEAADHPRAEAIGLSKRDLMTEFSKIDLPTSAHTGSKDKANYSEGGIFGGKVEVYPSLHDQLDNPKMKEALVEIENHEGSQNRDIWTKISEAVSSVPNKPTSVQVIETEPAYSQSTFQRRDHLFEVDKNAPKMSHAHVKSDEKFGTTRSHQGQSLREQEDLDMSGTRERYSTPIKPNKFVYSYSGILSTSEQVNGSFRRISGVGDKFEPLQGQPVTPSKQYFDTPDFSFADRRNIDIEKQFYHARQSNAQRRGQNVNERLYAKAKFISSPYERLVAPLRISSIASTKDS